MWTNQKFLEVSEPFFKKAPTRRRQENMSKNTTLRSVPGAARIVYRCDHVGYMVSTCFIRFAHPSCGSFLESLCYRVFSAALKIAVFSYYTAITWALQNITKIAQKKQKSETLRAAFSIRRSAFGKTRRST